jgi:N-acetylated-alpha-linked acidic dipeptidase
LGCRRVNYYYLTTRYGLIGSTEWCEQFSDLLKKEVVAYINVDNLAGKNPITPGSLFHAEASPSLAQLIREESMNVKILNSNNTEVTLYEYWKYQDKAETPNVSFPIN